MQWVKNIVLFSVVITLISFGGGLSIAQHYCADEIKSTTINTVAQHCSTEEVSVPIDGIHKVPCCFNEYSFYQTPAFEKGKQIALSATIVQSPIAFVHNDYSYKPIPFRNTYVLPPPNVSICIKVQRFLI